MHVEQTKTSREQFYIILIDYIWASYRLWTPMNTINSLQFYIIVIAIYTFLFTYFQFAGCILKVFCCQKYNTQMMHLVIQLFMVRIINEYLMAVWLDT